MKEIKATQPLIPAPKSFPYYLENSTENGIIMSMQPIEQDNIAAKANAATVILDHLVDALGGEPACKLMRAMILVDIDEQNKTTQSDIMERTE